MPLCNSLIHTAQAFTRRLRQERGQSLVEFGIVLPVLVLIILGIIYFGRYEDYANQETQLAEEGVRWAALNWTSTGYTMPSGCTGTQATALQCYIQGQAQSELQKGSRDVTAAKVYIYQPGTSPTYQAGSPVRVCVVTTVKFPTPIGVPSLKIAQAATMRIEQTSSSFSSLPYTTTNPTSPALASSGCPTT
jgi:Flp pilus assembly protein TadG